MEDISGMGYQVLKNVFSDKDLISIDEGVQSILKIPEVANSTAFLNSGRIHDPTIRASIMSLIREFSMNHLKKIFDENCFESNTTGAFQIKPAGKNTELNPHQDSPVIDENLYNGLYVWIPLIDINEKNGPVYVLPNSHKWGNYQRSLNVKWPFEKHINILKKQMIPIHCNRGDVLIWDTALIHSSSPNLSGESRIAFTTTLLPKNFEMLDFFKDKKTPSRKVERYKVYESYWQSADILKRPPIPPNEFIGLEDYCFENLSPSEVKSLLEIP